MDPIIPNNVMEANAFVKPELMKKSAVTLLNAAQNLNGLKNAVYQFLDLTTKDF